MNELRSFPVLLESAGGYRLDGAFRYRAKELPQAGEVITVEDELGGPERQARVNRTTAGEQFPIYATALSGFQGPSRR
jgi:hypothetical protein